MRWIGQDTNPNAEPVGVPAARAFVGPDAARNEELALLAGVLAELKGIRGDTEALRMALVNLALQMAALARG